MDTKLRIEDFEKIKVVTNIQYDSNAHLGYCLVVKPKLESNTYIKSLFRIKLESKIVEEIEIDMNIDNYVLAGENILIVHKEVTGSRIFSYNVYSKVLESLCMIPYEIVDAYYIDELLVFKTRLKDGEKEAGLKSYKQMSIGESCHIYTYNFDSSQLDCISLCGIDVDKVTYNKGDQHIVYTGFEIGDIKPICTNIFAYDFKSKETKSFTNCAFRINEIGYREERVLFTGVELEAHSRNDNQDTYCLNIDTGEIKSVTSFKDKSLESLGVMGDSHFKSGTRLKLLDNKAYYITVDRFGETLRSVDFEGREKVYDTGLTTIDSFMVCDSGIIASGLKGTDLHEIYWITETSVEQLTTFNIWQKDKNIIKPIYHNANVDGWVMPPVNFEKGHSYPGVLMIHGGPKAIYSNVYSHDMQLLSQMGYFVFYCNPRGSDGRGDAFSNIRGHYGEWAYEDLMDWTNYVVENYLELDSERLGVMGGSYGGYMTNYIITHTNRFKAAISARGISSMKTAFLSSDIGFEYIHEYMGNIENPWSDAAKYDEASPLCLANVVKTPTLFMHGEDDVRCNYMESAQMYNALLYLGVETEICLFEKEGHGYEVVGRPMSKQRRYVTLLNWFQKYFKEECKNGID